MTDAQSTVEGPVAKLAREGEEIAEMAANLLNAGLKAEGLAFLAIAAERAAAARAFKRMEDAARG